MYLVRRALQKAAAPAVQRSVIVTGGANGIGRGVVAAFLAAGERVACFDTDEAQLKQLSKEHAAVADRLTTLAVDVSDHDAVRAGVDIVAAKNGTVHVLVNNCGIQPPDTNKPLHLLPPVAWHKIISVNLDSLYYMTAAVLPHMLRNAEGHTDPRNAPGVILNMASVQGLQSQRGVPAYAASKGAMLSLTRQLALEYGEHGIRVLAINPGTVATPLVLAQTEAGQRTGFGEFYPLRHRICEPEEVGDVAVFLASPGASFMTGSSVDVDGGILAQGCWGH